jgi:GNAT superfamily N-acetyltransferase
VIVKSSALGRVYGDAADTVAHVSALAFSHQDVGRSLLEAARTALAGLGFKAWQFGGDWRHFFPGVPSECGSLTSLLLEFGLVHQGASVFDVERDLQNYEPPFAPSPLARRCQLGDKDALDEFFVREFPGRWRTDTMEKFSEDPSRVIGLFIEGRCQGFAMTQLAGDAHRRAGAAWSADLGPNWAALGSIGVAKSVRGEGHGHALLSFALCALRDQGARRTIIDWTTLTEFYGRHGFEVSRTYETYSGKV